jgi:hypothetical protein
MTCPCSVLHWNLDCPEHGHVLRRSLETDEAWRAAEREPVTLKEVLADIMRRNAARVDWGG